MGDVNDRASIIFGKAGEKIVADCKAMHDAHSARGILKSGATLKSAAYIFCENSGEALRQVLAEVSNKIENRGHAWTDAMAQVRYALEAHAANASALLEPSFKVAATPGDAAYRATLGLIDKCIAGLKSDLDSYEAGWTAPKPRPWIERHPVAWAIALVIGSAIAGGVVTLITAGDGQ